MNDDPEQRGRLGDIVQDFVNRIAHRGGQTLAIISEASVTLQQVIVLNRILESGTGTPSELAATLGMSLPSVSQMIDRLHRLGLLTRAEHSLDRRKKEIALTQAGSVLLTRLHEARSAEFETGVARLSPKLRSNLERLLRQAIRELDTRRFLAANDGPLPSKGLADGQRIPERHASAKSAHR